MPEVFKAAYFEIANYILNSFEKLDLNTIEKFIQLLVTAYKEERGVLVVGMGRSGLVARGFAMRLRHLGLHSYVLGETITPPVKKDDIVVAISGSGTTQIVVAAAEAAKKMGAVIVAVTSYPDSPLAKLADLILFVPGRTKVAVIDDYFARQVLGLHEPLSPLGTLFEDTAMVVLDAVIADLMRRLGKNEQELAKRHANIEVP